jgi:hypothetical protein
MQRLGLPHFKKKCTLHLFKIYESAAKKKEILLASSLFAPKLVSEVP